MTGKILVVDDDPHVLYLLRIILKTEGFTVLTCEEEEKALDMIRRERPNFVILDILMPKLNGWEICKALRNAPETQKLPIMIMSSVPYKEKERLLARELDVYDYITKPFEPIQLLGKIKALLSVPQPLRHLVKEEAKESGIRRGKIKQKVEVLVVGGGIAGLATAEAAARAGAQVMLVNEWPFLGGECVALHEMVWPDEPETREEKFFRLLEKNSATRYSPRLKGHLIDLEKERKTVFQFLREYQIPFKINSHPLDVIRDSSLIKGVVIDSESGPERIEATVTVDATLRGDVVELAGVPVVEEPLAPVAHFILGGIDGEELENYGETHEIPIHPLPSMREAVWLDVKLGENWREMFYEGIESTLSQMRENVPGCRSAYILHRPLHVMTKKRAVSTDIFPNYGHIVPATFEQILAPGWLTRKSGKKKNLLADLYRLGKIAGTLAGVSVSLNQKCREVSPEIVRDALKAEGIIA